MRNTIASLLNSPQDYLGQSVRVCGRIRTVREMKGIAFVQVWDGSCLQGLQVVVQGDLLSSLADASTGAVVAGSGHCARITR